MRLFAESKVSETDDDNVDMRFAARLACPCESAMREMNLQSDMLKELVPKRHRPARLAI